MRLQFILPLLGLAAMIPTVSKAGEDQHIVGYANGKPLYVSGPARKVAPAQGSSSNVQMRRTYVSSPAPRVNVGSYGTYHGPIISNSYNAGGYADAWGSGYAGGGYINSGYGFANSGYGYGNAGYGWNNAYGNGNCVRRPMTNIYRGANQAGYISIPRYR